MPFPYGAVIAAAGMMRRNQEESKKKRTEQQKSDEHRVKDIIVVYENGDCRTIKHGFAVESHGENCTLDYKDCTDEQFLYAVNGLAMLAKEKGLLD